MGTPKNGDRVRVAYEGTYKDIYAFGGHTVAFDLPSYGEYMATVPAGAKFEVLPKPLKVGDTIEGSDAYRALPEGTVVRRPNGETMLRTARGYEFSKGESYGAGASLAIPATLVYLPEQAA